MLLKLRWLLFPVGLISAIILATATTGYIISKLAPGLLAPYFKSVLLPGICLVGMLVLLYFKKNVQVSRLIALFGVSIALLLSLPGSLHEFNKYRTVNGNDETVRVSAADLSMIKKLNELNTGHQLVLVANEQPHTDSAGRSYAYTSLTNAPVLNEASQYFGVYKRPAYLQFEKKLDAFYQSKNPAMLSSIADEYGVGFFVFNNSVVQPRLFNGSDSFTIKTDTTAATYLVAYTK